MPKKIEYVVLGENIPLDKKWRDTTLLKKDKEYSVLSVSNGAMGSFRRVVLRVADDSAIMVKIRYPKAKVSDYEY